MEEEKGEQEEEANLKHNDFIDSIENFIEKFTITRICGMRGSNQYCRIPHLESAIYRLEKRSFCKRADNARMADFEKFLKMVYDIFSLQGIWCQRYVNQS